MANADFQRFTTSSTTEDVRQIQEDIHRLRFLGDTHEREEVSRQEPRDDGEVASNNYNQLWLRNNRLSICILRPPLAVFPSQGRLLRLLHRRQHSNLGRFGGLAASYNGRLRVSQLKQGVPDRFHNIPGFGLPLADTVNLCPPSDIHVSLPAPVYGCLECVFAMSAESEDGIFRFSGSSAVVKTLKERLDTRGDVDLLSDGVRTRVVQQRRSLAGVRNGGLAHSLSHAAEEKISSASVQS